MKKKADKKKDLEALREQLARRPKTCSSTGFEKMTVSRISNCARRFAARAASKGDQEQSAEKAAEGTPAGELLKDLKGMTSIAYTPAIRWRWPRR